MDTTLDDYQAYLNLRDDENLPFILIGGQAANFWANRYADRLPELRSLHPFTSRDIDFFGTRKDVRRISKALGLKPYLSTIDAPDPIAGYITPTINGEQVRVEFLHWIMNLSEEELRRGAVSESWHGNKIRVVTPIYLLQSKIGCLGHLSQADRQDEKHTRMLLPCVRCFLEDALERVATGKLTERGYIKTLKHVLSLSSSNAAKMAGHKAVLPWEQVMPSVGLFATYPRITNFLTQTAAVRYPHVIKTSYFSDAGSSQKEASFPADPGSQENPKPKNPPQKRL